MTGTPLAPQVHEASAYLGIDVEVDDDLRSLEEEVVDVGQDLLGVEVGLGHDELDAGLVRRPYHALAYLPEEVDGGRPVVEADEILLLGMANAPPTASAAINAIASNFFTCASCCHRNLSS